MHQHRASHSDRRELWITRASLLVTFATVVAFARFVAGEFGAAVGARAVGTALETVLFFAAILFLVYGNVLYQICRAEYHRRRAAHRPASRDELDVLFADDAPSLTILVPSYKEESRVVWQTLVSAALTQYPRKSVVLLIDDPHRPASLIDASRLQETRNLPLMLQERFRNIAAWLASERDQVLDQRGRDLETDAVRLADAYSAAAEWLEQLAVDFVAGHQDLPHGERFFVEQMLYAPARSHADFANELRGRVLDEDVPSQAFIDRQFARVASLFDAQFSTFERKKYRNLSREANKAMNLNSYLSLMGGSWREVALADAWELQAASPELADFSIPMPDYVITLDADSLLLPDYAERLIHMAEQPANQRLAVVQTPYSSFPGSPVPLERMAGATTDLQYIVHQGFTGWGATFWVGANALIRRSALEDIKTTQIEHGRPVPVYIQDRTVIEDTESSIDLIEHGWSLYNYPARLAYSATPADFGSLLIQRRRWSNGGLLILPKLLRYMRRAPANPALAREFFMRFHYLASLAGGSLAMLLVFFYPFDDGLATVWVPLTAAPYFVLYARDLRRAGYRITDVARIYALNLALVPVVIGGVLKSIQQALTGAKIPFGRTPKIASRSAAPPLYALLEIALPLLFVGTFAWDLTHARWSHAAFSAFNSAMFGYAVVRLLGLRHTVADAVTTTTPDDVSVFVPTVLPGSDNFEHAELPEPAARHI